MIFTFQNFPTYYKTESREAFGQLYDFQNKSMLMLKENEVFKAVPWD
jgi:hypothetical protein